MKSLYAVMLGGRAVGCNTELHDTVFIVCKALEDEYPSLIDKWFGLPHRLHIDSSVELKYIDGYEVVVSESQPTNNDKSLYYVNFGGYQADFFGELHEANFYIASSVEEAHQRAKEDLCTSLQQQHRDDILILERNVLDTRDNNRVVDDILPINKVDQYYIHLKPTNLPPQLNIQSFYRRIGS